MTPQVKSKLLYLQILMLNVDSENARLILSGQTAGLRYIQPVINGSHRLWIFF